MERIRKSFRRKSKEKPAAEIIVELETGSLQTVPPPAPPTRMDRIRQSLRFRSKSRNKEERKDKEETPGEDILQIEPFDKGSKLRKTLRLPKKKSKKSAKYESDEESVRAGRCSFPVKYLGSIEVQESRGMEVCEAAVKVLKKGKKKALKATLHVSGDGLRVVEKKTSGMLVDQVIEKVSFCSPDRNFDKGFAYICRDGTTRRWICHCFMAKEDSGERLSHAVGVAFAICLERKQQRESDCGVTMNYNETDGTFTRFGSFRQGTITERILDPQTFKPSSPPPVQKVENPHAVARPHASDLMFQRQASFKGLSSLSGNSPFKRSGNYASLREAALPSNVQRKEKSRISLILEENVEEETEAKIQDLARSSAMSTGQDVTDSQAVSVSPPALGLSSTELLQNQINNNSSQQHLYFNSFAAQSNIGINDFASVGLTVENTTGGPAMFWSNSSSQIPTNSNLANNNSSSSNNNNNNGPEWRLPQLPAIFETKVERAPVQVARVPPVPQQQQQVEVDTSNPWDLVPDQTKLKHHSRSNSKTDSSFKDNPADSWLASLTSKISVEERSVSVGFPSSLEGAEDELEKEFAAIATRNARTRNTNPFKAVM